MNSPDVIASLRDLIAHLSRGNAEQAQAIVTDVSRFLKGMIRSEKDAANGSAHRAQQTAFAMDEVSLMLAEGDFAGAANSARDAVKEWKASTPKVRAE